MTDCDRVLSSDHFSLLRTDSAAIERRAGWINVGDLSSAVHFKIVKYERIKFLVIGEIASHFELI